jgi:archaellum component FlaF (FlaF/FlaG flagellin family)
MAILTSESHRAKQSRNMIILKKRQNYIYINIIENDVPRGMFNFSKENFIKDVTLIFENFCEEYIVPQKSISSVVYSTGSA